MGLSIASHRRKWSEKVRFKMYTIDNKVLNKILKENLVL